MSETKALQQIACLAEINSKPVKGDVASWLVTFDCLARMVDPHLTPKGATLKFFVATRTSRQAVLSLLYYVIFNLTTIMFTRFVLSLFKYLEKTTIMSTHKEISKTLISHS